ncbi:methyl-accepting chemotaxis protein [Ferrimonas sediminum]|uniref:Methyl-accepting chemotaxis protein n=1 Tax=Ferrimonas sediminum TaxID=718193 RepID=A0A1G8K5X4_9GAMM|nr:methyl-accepting chemotaxis protein [Ferrimonas sediminum]SDI38793.1 methyl-accepting chemotaxis protein [Ferrimonas sediminum]
MNIKISIKGMLQLTITLSLLAMFVLFWSTENQLEQTRQSVADEERLVNAVFALKDSRYYVVQIQQFLTDVGATRSDEAKAEAEASLQGAKQNLDRLVTFAPELAQQARSLQQQVTALHNTGVKMADAYLHQGTEAGNDLMKGSGGFDEASSILAENLDQLSQSLDTQVELAMAHTLTSTRDAEQAVLWGSLLISLFLIAVMGLLYRRTLTPLAELESSMSNIASGAKDLTVRLDDSGNDEIARVARSFNQFVGNIRELFQGFNQSTLQLASARVQLTDASNQTLHGMMQLQSETDQVAAAMNEMQATVTEVANNAEIAARAANESNEHAIEGETVVSQTTASINSLASGVEHAAQVLQKLETNVDDIGTILDVIVGIADQTNLLALNAAIEAARAGEQGRGFAVVADEVRTLAKRTQESTDQIQQMISQLQSGAKDAALAMQRSQEQAQNSTKQATQAGEALIHITESVATISSMATQIATAVEQQTSVANDINRNIVNISDEAKSTVMNAEDSNAASNQVGQLSEQLDSQIGQFRIS